MRDIQNIYLVLATDGVFIALNYLVQGIFVHASSSTTQEAAQTTVIVSKILNEPLCMNHHRKVLKQFLMQSQHRNLKFETHFFTVNWKFLLAVSLKQFLI